jgi:hypothetical protein
MSYAARLVRQSIDVLLDPRTPGNDAVSAAYAVALVCGRFAITLDEAAMADLMRAAKRWLPRSLAVAYILRALRTRRSPERARRLALGIERLASQCFEDGLPDTLMTLVRAMQDDPEWQARVTATWFVRALDRALERGFDRCVESLLCGWFRSAHDAIPNAELRACVERNPHLFSTKMALAPFLCWRVHEVAPTLAGWKALAANPFGIDVTPSPSSFGAELDVAVDTLESALAEEREGARRVTLARWLIELRGEA